MSEDPAYWTKSDKAVLKQICKNTAKIAEQLAYIAETLKEEQRRK